MVLKRARMIYGQFKTLEHRIKKMRARAGNTIDMTELEKPGLLGLLKTLDDYEWQSDSECLSESEKDSDEDD